MDTSQIDSVILSAVGEHWTKVAMVIARVIDAMSHGLPPGDESYEVISRRIEALVHDGRLVAQGDTKNWRFSEVRLKPNTVRQAAMTDEPGAFLKLEGVGELIATRTLTLRQENGPTSEIMVLLGKPQPLPKHEDYYCPYQIKGAGDEQVRYTCGVDSFQALHLALSTVAVELEVLNKELAGRLRWECDDTGGLGFPGFAKYP